MLTSAGTRTRFWGDLDRRIRLEWLLVLCALSLFTAAISYFSHGIGLTRLDHTFYDNMLAATTRQPARGDIVIIAIDDDSIAQLGYWPWRRSVHASLLRHLGGAAAVGMDIVFSDPNPAYPDDDNLLARAISADGNVVLPVLIDDGRAHAPIEPLASAARALGYINIQPDNDGVVRSIRLHHALASGKALQHFTLAMLQVAGKTPHMPPGPLASRALIPYTGPPGHFTMYPYAAVLDGRVPDAAFKGKYVIVGAWGTGLGDIFPTPLTHRGQPMAGVEILANVLQATLTGDWIRTPTRGLAALLSALPVLLLCLFLRHLSPRRGFFVVVLALLLTFLADALLLHVAHVWVAPAASLIGIILAGPVWSWRSQEAALQHIDRELEALHAEEARADAQPPGNRAPDGSLPTRITLLHDAIDHIRQLRAGELAARRQREETLRFISHDMRSPQNSILALSSLQAQPETRLPEEQLLQRINQHAGKTLALVDGFIRLAQAESMMLQARLIDLADLIAQLRDDYWVLATRHDIRLECGHDVPPGQAYMNGDESMMARALGNLVDNAIKYSADGTTVTCRLARQGVSWRITIADQGRGMDPGSLPELFTPFRRLDEDTAGNPAGSGLGLAFVKTVVTRHGGTISVASEPGRGTTFTVLLPAADPAEQRGADA
jgi:signal transduction histidine kinase